MAYLALLLRYTRKTFLDTKHHVIGNFASLNWSVNLGVPSPCVEDKDRHRFNVVGKAAWMLSVMENYITVGKAEDALRHLDEAPDDWEQDDFACDFDTIPEVAAATAGYALSALRREGVHLMIDVGASTVDVCGFLLYGREEGDQYSLLTADVRQLGTIRLHHERVGAIQRLHEKQAQDLRDKHDPLSPIDDDIEPYMLSREIILGGFRDAEDALEENWFEMLARIVRCLKVRRLNPLDWPKPLPMLLIGGGSKLPFFESLVAKFRERVGSNLIALPIPRTLSGGQEDYHRFAVAWGLSHRALDVGNIIPADRICDIDALSDAGWKDNFVDKDQV